MRRSNAVRLATLPPKRPALPALDRFLTCRLQLGNPLADKFSSGASAEASDPPVGEARCLAAIGKFGPLSVVELAARSNWAAPWTA